MTMKEKKLLLLGSTGSVGSQAADVARARGYSVRAICAKSNVRTVEAQIREFRPAAAAMSDPAAAPAVRTAGARTARAVADTDVRIYSGIDGICEMIADSDADTAINSIIGYAGLDPTLAVIESGKDLALANKESLVVAGDIVMRRARERGVDIAPVDSEHCAIDQCLRAGTHGEIKSLIITASGGPFYGKKRGELAGITVKQALAHPTWSMGQKITIDSATLMNKGFELIEAAHLFGVGADKIRVVVHRESIIHSMVEFADNSVIAQLSVPDMRLCVQYALNRPMRDAAVIERLDLCRIGQLSFAEPDEDTFLPLRLAREAQTAGGASAAVLNAANEIAVWDFLAGKCGFTDIIDTLSYVTGEFSSYAPSVTSLDGIKEADAAARECARGYLSRSVRG
ncbi:1-deoxy-D-xylulose 5-phosphate reductoisomerase [Anaerotruncus sp. CAG:390]|nr:1-deoxy-D-xylulose 5-phosphate reductoisomerase [Anaerotruncus sp. CAG:390]